VQDQRSCTNESWYSKIGDLRVSASYSTDRHKSAVQYSSTRHRRREIQAYAGIIAFRPVFNIQHTIRDLNTRVLGYPGPVLLTRVPWNQSNGLNGPCVRRIRRFYAVGGGAPGIFCRRRRHADQPWPAAAVPTKWRRRLRLAASARPLEMQERIGGIQRPGWGMVWYSRV